MSFFLDQFFSLQIIVSCIRLEFPSGNVGASLDKSNLSESRERKNLSWLRCQEIDRILPQMCLHSETGTSTPVRAPTRHYQRGISGLVWRKEDLQVALVLYEKLTVKMWCVSSQISNKKFFLEMNQHRSPLLMTAVQCWRSRRQYWRGAWSWGGDAIEGNSRTSGAKILDRLGGFSTMSQPSGTLSASTVAYPSSCWVVSLSSFQEDRIARRRKCSKENWQQTVCISTSS